MSKLLLDFSGGKPSAATIKADNYSGVISYVKKENTSSSVDVNNAYMTGSYYNSLIAAGLDVNFVYENFDRLAPINTGYSGGQHDAAWAVNDLNARGIVPRNIFMAHDIWETLTSAQIQKCRDYQRGAKSILGSVAGAYAFAYLLQDFIADNTATFTWLTGSASSKFTGLNVYQRNYGQVVIGGIQCDVSEVLTTDYGQSPNPRPVQPPSIKEKEMIVVKSVDTSNGRNVYYLWAGGDKAIPLTSQDTMHGLGAEGIPTIAFGTADYDRVAALV